MLKTMIKCQKCNEALSISRENIKKDKATFKDGDSISLVDLTYFECPSCGKRHFVQIDNAETKGLLLEVVRVFAKLSKMRKQGKSIKKKSGKYKKANGDLDKARNKLMKEYSGKTVHLEELNQDVILEFSV